MEITALQENTLKVKGKNITFLINPRGKVDSEVIIWTNTGAIKDSPQPEGGTSLVIAGPGEYETAGVAIKGEKVTKGVSYSFLEDNQSLLVLPSSESLEKSETEGYSGVIVLMDSQVEKFLPQVTADFIGVVGESEYLPADRESVRKVDKVNLKKIEEYKGLIVHLSK